ncbi:MAG: DUF11 domain-containing protein [Leptolyngbyaceae cyanobacterium RU_5_1]|nr:DUF11 domain-containing protein [Leptolyngbyaceae cyanobacterium RU_5_1]
MKRLHPAISSRVRLGLTGSAAALAVLSIYPQPVLAQTTLPSVPQLNFQTSGPARGPGIGDWYTTATSASTVRRHEFFVNITANDIARAGGSIVVNVRDAESGGPEAGTQFDEVSGGVLGTGGADPDPTRFQLIGPDGNTISSQIVPAGSPNGTVITFPAVSTPGVYIITSETGAQPIFGDANLALNDDDNGFVIEVPGVPDLLIGQFRGTFQNNVSPFPQPSVNFFFLVGPGTTNLFLRNFDLDNDGTVQYTSPTGAQRAGTVSGAGVWNGGGDLNNGGDTLSGLNPIADAGRWQISLLGYGSAFNNQSLLQANEGTDTNVPLLDRIPEQGGNVEITPSPDPPLRVGNALCNIFTVTNRFFTSDIINLGLNPATDPNFTTQFRDASGQTPLTDTDGDGRVDTGILRAREARNLTLCVTPNPGAPQQYRTQIVGTSFLDARLRQQAGVTEPPTQILLNKTDDFGPTGAAGFRIVKRITDVTRGGATLSGVNFNTVVDDPNSTDDNAPGWSQIPLLGVLALDASNPVRSGDEVTYTVYFLSDGSAPALDTSICDPIPGGTTFVLNSLQLKLGNATPGSIGNFFTPLAPLPENNSCPNQTNPNGATIVNLGTVSNTAGSNFGFVRFRVRVN